MATNTDAPARKGKATMATDPFLAACFQNLKDKPVIDFEALAKATGLSAKGAANKLRPIMKEIEEAGAAAWLNQDDAAVAKAPAKGTKRKQPTKKDAEKVAANAKPADADSDEEEPAKKKPARAKGAAKPKKSEAIVKSGDEDEEAAVAVTKDQVMPERKKATAKSKAKATTESKTAATKAKGVKTASEDTKKEAAPVTTVEDADATEDEEN